LAGFGVDAGRYIADGITGLTVSNNSCFFGDATKGTQNATNENVFGYNATGNGSNTVTIGDFNITNTYLRGVISTNSTTPSTSPTTGASVIPGGQGIGGNQYIGGNNTIGGALKLSLVGEMSSDTNLYNKKLLSLNLYPSTNSSGYRCLLGGYGSVLETLDTGETRIRASASSSIGGSAASLVTMLSYLPSTSTLSILENFNLTSTGIFWGINQVVSNRKTGWTAPTGTATRTTFATSTVTLTQLAERVKALIDDLTTHGLIGA